MATKSQPSRVDYNVLTMAINGAALSRRAALQMELAVGLIHFTQEKEGTEQTGKANLKAIYNGAGYTCMAKVDPDYKTVTRRINAVGKLFDKLGSRTVNGWLNSCVGDTEAMLAYVVTELQAYSFHTLDDVLDFAGAESNRSRAKKQDKNGPVTTVQMEAEEGTEEGKDAGAGAAPDLDQLQTALLDACTDDELNTFMLELMEKMAARAALAQQAA